MKLLSFKDVERHDLKTKTKPHNT